MFRLTAGVRLTKVHRYELNMQFYIIHIISHYVASFHIVLERVGLC